MQKGASKVFRLAPKPTEILERCAAAEGMKPGEWLNQLLLAYETGRSFNKT